MTPKVFCNKEIEGDHCNQIKSKPGFDVIKSDGVDVALNFVSLRVDILLTETEEDVENEEQLDSIVNYKLPVRCWDAKCSVVGIHDDRVCCEY